MCLFICLFIHSWFRPVRGITSKFSLKFLKLGISHQQLIRKHSYLDHRYPGGSAFIPWLLTPGSIPRGGARSKSWTPLKSVFLLFLLWKQLMQIVGQTWLNLVTWTCGSWSEGQHDLYFKLQWFCLISWRLFDLCTSYFGSMNQYDPAFYLKINVGHCDLYFMVQWFCLIYLMYIWTSLFRIMSQYDPKFDLKINIGHCDLYFMVHWFCITWRLFAVWTSYFGIMGQYDPIFDLKVNVGLCDLYFMVQWFCLISPKTSWCISVIFSDNETMWPKLWPQSKYVNMTYISWSSDFA